MAATLHHVPCGEVVYEDGLAWQRSLWQRRVEDAIGDVLLTLTHDPVYTAGRHADLDRNLLRDDTGVRVVEVERGGDLTYHGPGQLVAYPIVALGSSKDVRWFVDALLEACRRTVAAFGVVATVDARRPGLWVDGRKLAAVGVRLDRSVTFHGLALNVAPDLDQFRAGIIPCGITDAGLCSLASLGVDTDLEEVREHLVRELGTTLQRTVVADSTDARTARALGPERSEADAAAAASRQPEA